MLCTLSPRQKTVLYWGIILLGAALQATIPFLYMRFATGSWLPTIVPQLESDARYYLVQIREVLDGFPFLGNPYIREYASASFPGLLLPIWIAALPGLLGLSINAVFAVNTVFYILLTAALLYVLSLRLTDGHRTFSAAATLLGLAAMHGLLIRPAVLQTVFFCMILFMMAFFAAIRRPHAIGSHVWLGVMNCVAFYLYPYFWLISFSATGLLFLHALWMRDWKTVRLMLCMGIGVIVVCVPQILSIVSLFSDPLAQQINSRVGLVETHVVLPMTVISYKYLFATLIGLGILRVYRRWSGPEFFAVLLNAAVIIVAFSNVVTGKELELHSHPWWLSLPITAVTVAILGSSFLRTKNGREKGVLAVLLALLIGTQCMRVIRMNAFPYLRHPPAEYQRAIQDFSRVFDVLERANVHASVLLVPGDLATYIPVYSDNYVFYMHRVWLHTIPNDEVLERFLVQYVDDVDADFLREQVDGFAGYGPEFASKYHNNIDPIELIGGDALIAKILEQHKVVDGEYASYLQKYHVSIAITDAQSKLNPRIPDGASALYEDERFRVYRISGAN
jgi:hypothetical protein